MARYEELTIDQGSDVSLDVYLTNVDGSPKDLSGFSAIHAYYIICPYLIITAVPLRTFGYKSSISAIPILMQPLETS